MNYRRLVAPALGALALLAAPAAAVASEAAPGLRSADELDRLLAPIALYPDALIGIILPAATKPVDIVMAIRYLEQGGSRAAIDRQPWDDSVRALAHHREILGYLNDELLWTRDLAEAFLTQPDDVMDSVQRLRRRAFAAGTLRTTPEHRIILENDTIRIVPADPDVIYVPRYDSREVYVERRYRDPYPLITFGLGFSTGSWLGYDCDWRHRRIYVVDPAWSWHSHADWRWRRFHHGHWHDSPHWHAWRPTRRHHPIPTPRHYSPPPEPRNVPAPETPRRRHYDRDDSNPPIPRHAPARGHGHRPRVRPEHDDDFRSPARPFPAPEEPETRPRRSEDQAASPRPSPPMGRERVGHRPLPAVESPAPVAPVAAPAPAPRPERHSPVVAEPRTERAGDREPARPHAPHREYHAHQH